jgi:hypothetical protein
VFRAGRRNRTSLGLTLNILPTPHGTVKLLSGSDLFSQFFEPFMFD